MFGIPSEVRCTIAVVKDIMGRNFGVPSQCTPFYGRASERVTLVLDFPDQCLFFRELGIVLEGMVTDEFERPGLIPESLTLDITPTYDATGFFETMARVCEVKIETIRPDLIRIHLNRPELFRWEEFLREERLRAEDGTYS